MKPTDHFIIYFDGGMPTSTAQEKGECIRYRFVNGKKVPYIHHYIKPEVEAARKTFALKLKPHRPEKPSEKNIRLEIYYQFNVADRSKWGKYKGTRPDLDNLNKTLQDVMTRLHFWEDDSQVVEEFHRKSYAELASIEIFIYELGGADYAVKDIIM